MARANSFHINVYIFKEHVVYLLLLVYIYTQINKNTHYNVTKKKLVNFLKNNTNKLKPSDNHFDQS